MSNKTQMITGWITAIAAAAMLLLTVHLTIASQVGSGAINDQQVKTNAKAIAKIKTEQQSLRDSLTALATDMSWIRDALNDSGITPNTRD